MADHPMTLIERLRNPARTIQSTLLDTARTEADLTEAANTIERLALKKRPVAFRVLNDLGEWVYYDDECHAIAVSERLGTEYQSLYVRESK